MIYDFECLTCGTVQEVYRPISRCDEAPICCGSATRKVHLKAPMGYVDNMEAYQSVATGEVITSRRQRKYEMEKGGYIDANDFASTSAKRKAAKAKKQAEIQAIKDEVPADLQQEFTKITKQEKQKFLDSR